MATSRKALVRPFADELETKTKVKSLSAGLLLLMCNGLGDPSHEATAFLGFSARIFLEITRIDIKHKITLYKKVIIISKGRHFVILACLLSDGWRYHACDCLSRIPVRAELRGAALELF